MDKRKLNKQANIFIVLTVIQAFCNFGLLYFLITSFRTVDSKLGLTFMVMWICSTVIIAISIIRVWLLKKEANK